MRVLTGPVTTTLAQNMMKRWWTIPAVLLGLYLLMVLPRLPRFIESRRIDSGMSYSEFARPFKQVDGDWTEQRVIDTFGEPDKTETEEDIRRLIYQWVHIDVTWLLETPGTEWGGVSIHFRDGKMIGAGWSDSTDEELSQQPPERDK